MRCLLRLDIAEWFPRGGRHADLVLREPLHDPPAPAARPIGGCGRLDPGREEPWGRARPGRMAGGYFGRNLDALADCLRGGSGATAPFTVVGPEVPRVREVLEAAGVTLRPAP
ncbi:barstar family protein [Amycolatopsis sp. FBCC-B4732]|uniref:barstar family protein n=1 Tax=Amycolatopsis sp. FBCC-B4732 TaxID=3079339 RepID=UPI001FF3A52D|nr:barstar family protein [Amycolatopsis sp. FBCC-B4732]UOX85757.1 barstar family protein [Amycolatopsis sp. FBCC-B4732]